MPPSAQPELKFTFAAVPQAATLLLVGIGALLGAGGALRRDRGGAPCRSR